MGATSVSAPGASAGTYAELTGAGTGVGLWRSWGQFLQGTRKQAWLTLDSQKPGNSQADQKRVRLPRPLDLSTWPDAVHVAASIS